ncbi:sigma-70 family RNA polymerase sigma factor [Actinoplanes sp. NPDC051475]|uniref:RNA polymerase sigma factor n=1 Tax=Actinoplanes sp. NPDC051475 TaxID=3157225 RepID=UPI00344DD108
MASTMTQLFRTYWPTVVGYLTRRTGDRSLAEELAQETFARATAAFLGWQGGSPVGWLLAIARNVLTDHYRKTRRLVPIEDSLLPAEEFQDAGVEVRDLLSRLPPNSRRLLELVYLDGFSQAEVAAMTGRSPVAVRTAVYRARESLRALLVSEERDERDTTRRR